MSTTSSPTRLGPLDHAFLHLEDQNTSAHIGSLALFEGPVPSHEELRRAVARKLPLVPRYRQRIRVVPLDLARPVWVDYPEFDLEQHLNRLTLPAPGGDAELREVVDRVMSQPLDRNLPLWEDWVLEGLPGDRWAMVTKIHHSMADGISGTDLLSTVFDHQPVPGAVPPDDWSPRPEPGALTLAAQAVQERARVPRREAEALARAARHPAATARLVAGTLRGMAAFGSSSLRPVQRTSLLGPLGGPRLYRWTEVPFADVRTVRHALGGTVNDVVLAAVSGGFRELLLGRGEHVGEHTVRTLVPVSVRGGDQRAPDNRVSALLAELPVNLADPVERLGEVVARMRRLKASHEAETGEMVTELADFLPPPALAAFLHVAFRTPHGLLNAVTTNVPGPTSTLYAAGRRMLATYPYVPIGSRVRTGIAVTSYEGRLLFGVTADAASSPDVDVLVSGLETGFADLLEAASQQHGGAPVPR